MSLPTSVRKKDGGRIPGPATAPSVIEIRVVYSGANGKTNSFKFAGKYVTAPTDMQSLAGAMWTVVSGAWTTDFAPLMAPSVTLERVEVRDMTNATNAVFIGTAAAIPGTGSLPAMPPDVALVLTENVQSRGRGLKGRMYISGWVTAADAGNGNATGAVQTALNNFGLAIKNGMSTNNLSACVAQVARAQYIGLTGTTHPQRLATSVPVSSYTCKDTEWDTQRRRGF